MYCAWSATASVCTDRQRISTLEHIICFIFIESLLSPNRAHSCFHSETKSRPRTPIEKSACPIFRVFVPSTVSVFWFEVSSQATIPVICSHNKSILMPDPRPTRKTVAGSPLKLT